MDSCFAKSWIDEEILFDDKYGRFNESKQRELELARITHFVINRMVFAAFNNLFVFIRNGSIPNVSKSSDCDYHFGSLQSLFEIFWNFGVYFACYQDLESSKIKKNQEAFFTEQETILENIRWRGSINESNDEDCDGNNFECLCFVVLIVNT